jgi:alpha-amylase
MAKHIHLALAFHNHQPVGNFHWVFEKGYDDAYLPLIEALERHPRVRLALHYSGPLRDWLASERPELLHRIAALVARTQVEMMTGGYYEPILVALPDADKSGQIARLSQSVREDFGYEPKGAWLAERVWEPHLVRPLAEAGIDYTMVDDTHFKYVGLNDEDLFGYYVTEEQGHTLKVFATSKYLRYVIPWGTVGDVIDWLRSQADERGDKVAVMGDDGEKFGLWPSTHAHCWENGWMEEFFEAIEANGDWLTLIPPGEYAAGFPSLGRVYLPTASYDEMSEWSLPAPLAHQILQVKHQLEDEGRHDVLRFIRGGFWRSFQVKYDAVNIMHKKMLWVSDKVHAIPDGGIENSSTLKQDALAELWQGQCNCPYWHGVFGGIYLFHIRAANYAHLIRAERLADSVTHSEESWVEWEMLDFDRDGEDELVLTSDAQALVVDLPAGGTLLEWDWRHSDYNLVNTVTRRPEGYHEELRAAASQGKAVLASELGDLESIHTELVRVKEWGLERKLLYDWYRRGSLIDHFFSSSGTLEEFYRCQYAELGDFVDQPYECSMEEHPDGLRARLERAGRLWQDVEQVPLRVEKTLVLRPGSGDLAVSYHLTNLGERAVEARFGIETNWGILGGDGEGAYYEMGQQLFPLASRGELGGVARLLIASRPLGVEVKLAFSHDATLWRFPIEAISNSDAGFERTYQGSCLLAHWPLELGPGEDWTVDLSFGLTSS